jgi:hypothetical protein
MHHRQLKELSDILQVNQWDTLKDNIHHRDILLKVIHHKDNNQEM